MMHDAMSNCLCEVYLLRPYQCEKRYTLFGRTFSKHWTKNRQHGFCFLLRQRQLFLIIIIVSWIRCKASSSAPSFAVFLLLFCFVICVWFWLWFASVLSSFIYIFILTTSFCCCFFYARSISLKRFIGRHRSAVGSHYSLFHAKHEIRERDGTVTKKKRAPYSVT